MNCHQAESAIALEVGNDLDESAREELATHLARCPECCDYQRRLGKAVGVLQSPVEDRPWSPDDSVWPGVSSYLARAAQPASLRQHFNGWTPAMTVVAACAVMVAISILRPSQDQPTSTYYIGVPNWQNEVGVGRDFPDLNVVDPEDDWWQSQVPGDRYEIAEPQNPGVRLIETDPSNWGPSER